MHREFQGTMKKGKKKKEKAVPDSKECDRVAKDTNKAAFAALAVC
jgi:hypothetical protein